MSTTTAGGYLAAIPDRLRPPRVRGAPGFLTWASGSTGICHAHGIIWCRCKMQAIASQSDSVPHPASTGMVAVSVPIVRDSTVAGTVLLDPMGDGFWEVITQFNHPTSIGVVQEPVHRRDLVTLLIPYLVGLSTSTPCKKCGAIGSLLHPSELKQFSTARVVAHHVLYILRSDDSLCPACDTSDLVPEP